MVESDCAFTVQLILNAKVDNLPLGSLLMNCHALMHQSWSCIIRYIYHENNFVADNLARVGFVQSFFSKLLLLVVDC